MCVYARARVREAVWQPAKPPLGQQEETVAATVWESLRFSVPPRVTLGTSALSSELLF